MNKKIQLSIIGFAVLLIGLVGVTFAFFNYTRTGTANNIRTGRIYFNADQGSSVVTLSDLFPISLGENETVTSQTPGVGSLKLHITGDTNYTEGVEYLIEAVDVTGNGQTSLPISINISYAATSVEQGQPANVIGTNDPDYFTNRGGSTSRYKLLSTGSISEGEDILVGYIAPGNTGIDGELTILAYLNADNIAITDTYNESNPGTDYNGTTTNWVDGRTVFTTSEWNALQTTGVSFKIKATAQEGTWVDEPEPEGTIDSCPGCKFMYVQYSNEYHYGNNGSTVAELEADNVELVDDYRTLNSNYFLGLKIENNVVKKAYACGIKGEAPNQGTPFCLESIDKSATAYENNFSLITGSNLWDDADGSKGRCTINGNSSEDGAEAWCSGNVAAEIHYNTEYDDGNWVASEIVSDRLWCIAGGDTWEVEPIFYCGDLG